MAAFFGSILMVLLFAVLFILILGINILARFFGGINNLWNLVTGKGFSNTNNRRNNYYYNKEENRQSTTSSSSTSSDQGHRPHSKGVFGDDEGTYVDFEEIK